MSRSGVVLAGVEVHGYTSGLKLVEKHAAEIVLEHGGGVMVQLPPKEAWKSLEKVVQFQVVMGMKLSSGQVAQFWSPVYEVEAQA